MSSLRKFEIISELKSKYGISIKSVQALNKLLEEMGILKHCGNVWLTTTKGLIHSIYSSTQVINGDLWHETIVKEIANFIGQK